MPSESNQNHNEKNPATLAPQWLLQAAFTPYNTDRFTPTEELARFLGMAIGIEDDDLSGINMGMIDDNEAFAFQCYVDASSRDVAVGKAVCAIYQGWKDTDLINKVSLSQMFIKERNPSHGRGDTDPTDVTGPARDILSLYEDSYWELESHQA